MVIPADTRLGNPADERKAQHERAAARTRSRQAEGAPRERRAGAR
ncbi:hypothetical protein ACFPRL_30900 [Pseudoclavibacter helvolus]